LLRGVARWGVLGARDSPFASHVLRKQLTTGGKNDMKIWGETSFWHRVTLSLKNPGYAPGLANAYSLGSTTHLSNNWNQV